jgi:hypothetical protein
MAVMTRSYAGGALPQHLVWQSLSFMRCEWPFLFGGANRQRARAFGEPAWAHLVRTDGDVLLSYADIVQAEAVLTGERIDVLGLSNVFTFPPYRGEGHASQIVAAAGRLIGESTIDLAILFCEHGLDKFYSAHGWETAPAGAIVSPSAAPVVMVREGSARGAEITASLCSSGRGGPSPASGTLSLATAW